MMLSLQERYLELLKYKEELERRKKEEALERYYNKGPKVHKKQIEFHKDSHRLRALFGGNRTGKTVAGAVEAVYYATGKHPYKKIKVPNRGWVVSLTNEVQRDVAQKEILRWLNPKLIKNIVMRRGSKEDLENGIIDLIVLTNGSVIGFKSVDQGREKFQGTAQSWIWMDEEPPKEIFDECKMRTIDTRGDIWITMTPLKGLTWVYNTIYLNENNDPNIKYWIMEWADNPFLSEEEIKMLESTMSEEEREARQYGRFVALSGLVYKEFREDIHVIDPFDVPREWYDEISVDPGYAKPLSAHWYAVNGEGDVFVIAEHYEAEKDIEYHAKRIYEISDKLGWHRTRTNKIKVLMDKAADQHTLQSEKSVSDLFYEHGIICDTSVDKNVWVGIQRVKEYLKLREHPEKELYPKGKPKLFVFRTCENMIREFKSYRWKEAKDGEEPYEKPKKVNDHCLTEDTIVNTVNGNYRIIDLIGETGKVYCYDGEKAAIGEFYNVRPTLKNVDVYEVELEDGRKIKATYDHPILTAEGWKLLKDLKTGDEIIDISGEVLF